MLQIGEPVRHSNVKDVVLLHLGKSVPGRGSSGHKGPEAGGSKGSGHCSRKRKNSGMSSEISFFKNGEDVGQPSVASQHEG